MATDPRAVRVACRAMAPLLRRLTLRVGGPSDESLEIFQAAAREAHRRGGAVEVFRLLGREVRDVRRALRAHRSPRAGGALGRDLRVAFRRMRSAPVFSGVAMLSLALAIGANTAIFSLVEAVLLRDSVVRAPEELVELYFEMDGFRYGTFSPADFRDLRRETQDLFTDLVATKYALIPRDQGGAVTPAAVELVTGGYFTMQGIGPALGRLIGPEDDVVPGGHPVAVLDHRTWSRRYGADPGVLGRDVRVAGRPYTIIGVTEPGYAGALRGLTPELYIPFTMTGPVIGMPDTFVESRSSYSLFLRGRLSPGVTDPQVTATLQRFTERMRAEHPDRWDATNRIHLVRTEDVLVNPAIDPYLEGASAALLVAVGLVLLVACANLAAFLLARAEDRRKEIAVRLAMGSGRAALLRQLLTETLLLAGLGGLLGLLVAAGLVRLLQAADLPVPVPISVEPRLGGVVLAFTVLVTGAAGLLFGLAPALQSTRTPVAATLRAASAGSGGGPRSRLRGALVALQVAVSVACLVVAGLFVRSMRATAEVDPGFGAGPTAVVNVVLPESRFPGREEARAFLRQAVAVAGSLPGVVSAGVVGTLHLDQTNSNWTEITVPGVPLPAGRPSHRVPYTVADAAFFSTMGIDIVEGRAFEVTDGESRPVAAVVSRAMANRFFPEGAVGGTFTDTEGETYRVVGVAADTKVSSLREAPQPFIYASVEQDFSRYVAIVARTRGDVGPLVPALLEALRDLDPEIYVASTTTLERHLGILLLPLRLASLVFAAFAVLALLLAAIGLYGVVSYTVARSAREMSVRLALGASPAAVVRLMFARGFRLVVTGLAVGLLLAAAMGQGLESLLVGVGGLDPLAFIAAPTILLAVACSAAWLPARRAAWAEPAGALRGE